MKSNEQLEKERKEFLDFKKRLEHLSSIKEKGV